MMGRRADAATAAAFAANTAATEISILHVSRIMMSRDSFAAQVFPRSMGVLVQTFKRKSVEN
jgi:hypothetical protein